MKIITIYTLGLLMLLFISGNSAFCQDSKPVFIGIQPGITIEKFYAENEFDVNILPFVIQFPLARRFDLRMTLLANYHFGAGGSFSDVGIQSLIPFFLRSRETANERSHGFYLAPVAGFGKNIVNDHFTITTAIEPGYMFYAEQRFTLSLGIQFGASYFMYNDQPDLWRQHFGVKINLGFWIVE